MSADIFGHVQGGNVVSSVRIYILLWRRVFMLVFGFWLLDFGFWMLIVGFWFWVFLVCEWRLS